MDTPQLQPDELDAVITTAHDWGRKVTAHAGPAGIIDKAVRLGLDCVEHGYHLTGDVARLMAERGVTLVPTLRGHPVRRVLRPARRAVLDAAALAGAPAAATSRATRWRSRPGSR